MSRLTLGSSCRTRHAPANSIVFAVGSALCSVFVRKVSYNFWRVIEFLSFLCALVLSMCDYKLAMATRVDRKHRTSRSLDSSSLKGRCHALWESVVASTELENVSPSRTHITKKNNGGSPRQGIETGRRLGKHRPGQTQKMPECVPASLPANHKFRCYRATSGAFIPRSILMWKVHGSGVV